MDIDRLCALATKAIETVLRYHSDFDVAHDGGLPAFVWRAIRDLYHLRDMAHVQDTRVADLEIACDAALSVAEAYNMTSQNQVKVNLRWFYHCVQGLLIPEIKPELLPDGEVERLSRIAQSQPQQPQPQQPQQRPSQPATGDAHFSSASSSPTFAPGSSLPSPSSPKRSATSSSDDSSATGSAKRVCMAKANWEDDEIRLMVELKASGMRHSDIAARLGRGLGSVENKYGRIMHQNKWKDYLAQIEAKLKKKRKRSS